MSMQGAVSEPQIEPAKSLLYHSGRANSSSWGLEAAELHLHDTVLEQVTLASLPSPLPT